jgi:hypothetical protein
MTLENHEEKNPIMAAVRLTTASKLTPERPERDRAVRNPVKPVAGAGGVDADRYHSLREELTAAEERFPTAMAEDAVVGTKDVVDELNRLGSDAVRVLQPLNEKALRLVERDHIDEQV